MGGTGKACEWPTTCHRPGAFLAGRISLFLEPKVLRSKERDPFGTTMNATLQQCQLCSAARLMTHEKTAGKFNRTANPYREPALDESRCLAPTKQTAGRLLRLLLSCGPRAKPVKALPLCQPLNPEGLIMCPEHLQKGKRPPSAPSQFSAL